MLLQTACYPWPRHQALNFLAVRVHHTQAVVWTRLFQSYLVTMVKTIQRNAKEETFERSLVHSRLSLTLSQTWIR